MGVTKVLMKRGKKQNATQCHTMLKFDGIFTHSFKGLIITVLIFEQ